MFMIFHAVYSYMDAWVWVTMAGLDGIIVGVLYAAIFYKLRTDKKFTLMEAEFFMGIVSLSQEIGIVIGNLLRSSV